MIKPGHLLPLNINFFECLLLSILLASCASSNKPSESTPENLDLQIQNSLQSIWKTSIKENFSDTFASEIYVFTNRQMKSAQFGCNDANFGISPSEESHLGICQISVPKNHATGTIPLNKDGQASPHDFFKTSSGRAITQEQLITSLIQSKRTPLVFVHGFNVKYQEAILRAAQIGYDLKYQGPIILFTWPSGAGGGFMDETLINKTYAANTKTAQQSVAVFKSFLTQLHAQNISINLMVHSMGHQVVLPALQQVALEQAPSETGKPPLPRPVQELILNAPDFEADAFLKMTADLKHYANHITLYCSTSDKAMAASETMNKNKRLGACISMEDVDTINVTQVDNPGTTGLGHGYYSSRPVLNDIYQLFLGLEAPQRLFIRKSEPNSDEKYFLRP